MEYDYNAILNAINNNIIATDNDVQRNGEAVRSMSGNVSAIRANTQEMASNQAYTNTLINTTVVPAINRVSDSVYSANRRLIEQWNSKWGDVRQINTNLEQIFSSASGDFDYNDTNDYSSDVDYDDAVIDTASLNLRDTVMAHKRSLDSVIAYVDSVRNDTTTHYVALDSIYDWSDTSTIKQKLSDFFIPNMTPLQSCPAIDYTIEWPSPIGTQRWYVPFGNLYGRFDLCEICRQIVKFLTLIIITFNSIKSVIRAFSSGGT